MNNFPTTSLQYGQSGSDVTKLQQFLISQGMNIPSGATGYFGNETKAAVAAWQQKNGVDNSTGPGVWGPRTIAKATTITQPASNTGATNVGTGTGSIEGQVFKDTPTGRYYKMVGGKVYETDAQGVPISVSSTPPPAPKVGETKTENGKTMVFGADGAWHVSNAISATQPKNFDSDGDGILDTFIETSGLANTNLRQFPEEGYKVIVPQLTPGTAEYQAAMDKIDTAYFDVLQQQMNASTEQQKAVADYNWQTLKKSIETNLNTTLSNDAFQAWDQIQTIKSQYGQGNIAGSGLENESIDTYLNKVRRSDSLARNDAQTKQESAQQDFYMKFATPEQVKALIASDPTKAQAWGLMPSNDVKTAMNPATLKAKYPKLTDDEIQAYIASVVDENGNYRSALYQKHMLGSNLGINAGNETIKYDADGNPITSKVTASDTGMLDILQAKKDAKESQVYLENARRDKINRDALGTTPVTTNTQFDRPATDPNAGSTTNGPANLARPIPQVVVPPSMTTGTTSGATGAVTGTTIPSPKPVTPTPAPTPAPTTKTYSTVVPKNPMWMTEAEMMGGSTGLKAYQARVAKLPK